MSTHELLQNPLVKGAVSGLFAAVVVDLHAFANWRQYDKFADFNYKLMLVRWMQGICIGALSALGYNAAT